MSKLQLSPESRRQIIISINLLQGIKFRFFNDSFSYYFTFYQENTISLPEQKKNI